LRPAIRFNFSFLLFIGWPASALPLFRRYGLLHTVPSRHNQPAWDEDHRQSRWHQFTASTAAKSVFHLENDGIEFDTNNGLPLSDPAWTWSRPWDGVIAVAISFVRPEP
jgi:hypothetical protein